NEFAPKAEHRRVHHVIDLDCGTQPGTLIDFEFSREIQIKNELTWTETGIARKVSRLSNGWQRELIQDTCVKRSAGFSPFKQTEIAVEDWTIVPHIVEIAIRSAQSEIERRARGEAQNG